MNSSANNRFDGLHEIGHNYNGLGVSVQAPSGTTSRSDAGYSGFSCIAPKTQWPDLILQPDSSPVSEVQLTTEIKGIYAGLVIVEAKCIHLDAAQASNCSTDLEMGQWQALIALHRTLLYEHHDFLMATQHPSATPALKALPTKCSMPARMWKHGIHTFLEVLRHRRPASEEYMLSFIYLASQMMALLYETAPIFLDTWIECLGDLARYRMAIEEEKESHAQWGGVAASWYIKASDRHPQIGRLYHHLAILERPSLRKFACYGKSLTCVVPFPNARDSLHTLCVPIAEEAQPALSLGLLSEASFCKLHALIFLGADQATLEQAYYSAISFLRQPKAFRWRDCGVPLAVANISALLGHGSHTNPFRIAFDSMIQRAIQRSRPSHSGSDGPPNIGPDPMHGKSDETQRLLQVSKRLTLDSLHTAAQCLPGTASSKDSLAFFGVMFCFIHFLCRAKREAQHDPEVRAPLDIAFGPDEIDWVCVAGLLNHLAHLQAVNLSVFESAHRGGWLEQAGTAKPLPEDFSIRGLVWAYFAFPPGWFDTDEDEDWKGIIETAKTHKTRADRVLYYGFRIAIETQYFLYDAKSRTFSQNAIYKQDPNTRRSSVASTTTSSDPDSGFVHVKGPAK
ncbi:hypothetical protein LTR17_018556 [Elasticomyces elasticus]|nr:hypothetical protein LTR17_018556 [Elasticomyces elasticus]